MRFVVGLVSSHSDGNTCPSNERFVRRLELPRSPSSSISKPIVLFVVLWLFWQMCRMWPRCSHRTCGYFDFLSKQRLAVLSPIFFSVYSTKKPTSNENWRPNSSAGKFCSFAVCRRFRNCGFGPAPSKGTGASWDRFALLLAILERITRRLNTSVWHAMVSQFR